MMLQIQNILSIIYNLFGNKWALIKRGKIIIKAHNIYFIKYQFLYLVVIYQFDLMLKNKIKYFGNPKHINKDMEFNLQTPFKKIQRNPTQSVRSKTKSNRVTQLQNQHQKDDQLLKTQIELRYAEEKAGELQQKMIRQMKRIGDGSISHMYGRMMKQQRQLRKEIRELKIKNQILMKEKQRKIKMPTNVEEQQKQSKLSKMSEKYKNIQETKSSRMKSEDRIEKGDLDGKSVKSRKKSASIASDFKSQKSQQLVKYQEINNQEQIPKLFHKSKFSRKDTIQSLKAQLIKSQILIGEGIELIKKNSDPICYPTYHPCILYSTPYNASPVFAPMFRSSNWL